MQERMVIEGGHQLVGSVRVSGGKNTSVAIIPATILSDTPCTVENLPNIEDVAVSCKGVYPFLDPGAAAVVKAYAGSAVARRHVHDLADFL